MGSKVTESAKATSLVLVLLDFEHAAVTGRTTEAYETECMMSQFREVTRTRTFYSMEAHACDFVMNALSKGKPVQLFRRGVEW